MSLSIRPTALMTAEAYLGRATKFIRKSLRVSVFDICICQNNFRIIELFKVSE